MKITLPLRFHPNRSAVAQAGARLQYLPGLDGLRALAIIAAAQRTVAGKHSAFASPLQVRLGEWSYAFYLVHASFVYIALRIFGVQPVSWWNLLWFAALLCIALAAAAALHHLVEKPFERRMRAWKDAREAS